jgi:hypothetical protein
MLGVNWTAFDLLNVCFLVCLCFSACTRSHESDTFSANGFLSLFDVRSIAYWLLMPLALL